MAGFTEKTIRLIKTIMGVRNTNPNLPIQKLYLVVKGLPEDSFMVIDFTSEGALNRCYRIEATLASENPAIDMALMVRSKVFVFSEESQDNFIGFKGFVYECEQLGAFEGKYVYRVVLGPKLSFLTQTFHNQIFLDRTSQELLEEILIDGGLLWDEFEFRLQGDLSKRWEYVCQYRESHFDFFSRWLEREGLYFFFEATDDEEKLIITDSVLAHPAADANRKLLYRPVSGLEYGSGIPILDSFTACQTRTPGTVTVKDYNYRNPSLDLTGTAVVDPESTGEVYLYGDHLQSPEESARIAKTRAEAITCRTHLFKGRSNAAFLRTGLIIEIEDHFRAEYNSKYLVTQITHEGHQQLYLFAGLQKDASEHEKKPLYRNSFTAIPANMQYRPPLATQKPRFHGVINAHIDAEGSGKYPEIDEQGRYKVTLPFDLAGRKGGKASAWVRMAQPYAGEGHGMHFPLHKGTEVLLTFVDGDPDRPIIAAAVSNPLTPSVVNSDISTQNRITTAGGNKIHIEDQEGKKRILLHSPSKEASNSYIRLGVSNDPPSEYSYDDTVSTNDEEHDEREEALNEMIDEELESGLKLHTDGLIQYEAGSEVKTILGAVTENILGAETTSVLGGVTETVVGIETSIVAGMRNHITFLNLNEFALAIKFACQLCAGIEYAPEKLMLSTMKNELHEMKHDITANKKNISILETDVRSNATVVTGIHKTLTNKLAAINGEIAELNGSVDMLVDNENKLARQTMKLQESSTELNNKVSVINGKAMLMQADVTSLNDNVKKLSNKETAVATSKTQVCSKYNLL